MGMTAPGVDRRQLEGSEHPCFEARSHCHSKLFALIDKGVLPLSTADQRILDGAPSQSRDDRFDAPARSSTVLTRTGCRGRRAAPECVRGRDSSFGRKNPSARRSCIQGSPSCRGSRPGPRGHRPAPPGEAGSSRTVTFPMSGFCGAAYHRLSQPFRVGRGRMGDDEQAAGGHGSVSSFGTMRPLLRRNEIPAPDPFCAVAGRECFGRHEQCDKHYDKPRPDPVHEPFSPCLPVPIDAGAVTPCPRGSA